MRTSFELFYIVIAVITVVYAALHYYIGLRGWQYLIGPLGFIPSKIYWSFFGLIAGSYIFARFAENFLPHSLNVGLTWIGSYWMATFFYLLLILLIVEIVRISIRLFKFQDVSILQTPNLSQYLAYGIVLFVLVIMSYGTWNAWSPRVVPYDVEINKASGSLDQIKVAMVSDIHLGITVGPVHLEKLVRLMEEMRPDLILLVGDTIDNSITPLENDEIVEFLGRLEAPYGVYGVVGNHEHYSGEVDKFVSLMESSGITILRDSHVKIKDAFYLVGREDYAVTQVEGLPRKKVEEVLADIDHSLPILVMDHQPRNFAEAEAAGVDLLLSGHSHRGQLFPLNFITSKIYEQDWGYLKKDRLQVLVSSGFSPWGPPVRLGSRSEIVEINIKFKK